MAVWGWMGFVAIACSRWIDRREIGRDELHDPLVASTLTTFGQVANG